jgi:hypothetical protein
VKGEAARSTTERAGPRIHRGAPACAARAVGGAGEEDGLISRRERALLAVVDGLLSRRHPPALTPVPVSTLPQAGLKVVVDGIATLRGEFPDRERGRD